MCFLKTETNWLRDIARRAIATKQKNTGGITVRYIIPAILAVALGFGIMSNEEAEAGSRCNCPRCQQIRRQQTRQPSLFQQMMELERRKNAWLKRTFLGR